MNANPAAADAKAFAAESNALFDYKREALQLAKTAAEADGRRATMTDYFIAAVKLGESKSAEMSARGIQWGPQVIADLSGQTLDGFQINKADMEPPRNVQMLASIRARQAAQAQGRQPTLGDTLAALQQIQQSGEQVPSIDTMKDMMDLDGDHIISSFFAGIDHHAKFEKTIFANVSFHPAGTLMREGENGVALTEGASFTNVTFDGMQASDQVTLAKGDYHDIHFKNIKGGHIAIADGTQVDGLDIRGAHASLHIGRASLTHLDATDAHIIHLDAAPGAHIAQAEFRGATIDMASNLQGSTWKQVNFTDANLAHVDMNGASLSGVSFTNTNLKGLDVSAAQIQDMVVDGKPMTSPLQLAELGMTVDPHTKVNANPELVRNYELSQIRATMQGAVASIGSGAAPAEASASMAPAAPEVSAKPEPLTVDDIRQALQAAQSTIGNKLNDNENRTLAAIQEANQQRSQSIGRALPPLGRNA